MVLQGRRRDLLVLPGPKARILFLLKFMKEGLPGQRRDLLWLPGQRRDLFFLPGQRRGLLRIHCHIVRMEHD